MSPALAPRSEAMGPITAVSAAVFWSFYQTLHYGVIILMMPVWLTP
jgi:hypothetical protein